MRVGLVALSGVRVANPALAELGVTLPQFVSRGEVVASLPSLSLTTLAAVTPPEVDLQYIEVGDVEAGNKLSTDFDLVAFSSYTAQAYEMYEIADRFRQSGVPVVIGGLHASQVPAEAKEHADAVCIGEGEQLWPRVLQDFARDGVSGLAPFYREDAPGTYDLRTAPAPRFDLLLDRPYNRITVQTSRGCPLDCEFCGASRLYGPKYRQKTPEQALSELAEVQRLWGANAFVELADDNSFANPAWTRRFLEGLSSLQLRWFTETDLSIADDANLLRSLYRTGCRQVLIGLESPRSANLDGLDRANWKYKRRDQYKDSITRIQDHGVAVNGCFVVGNDGDDEGVFEEIRDFVDDCDLLETQVTILTPFPGTRLYQRLEAEGRLLYDRFWDRCTLFDVVFEPKKMTAEALAEGHMQLMREIYDDARTRRRRRHYIDIIKQLEPAADGNDQGAS